MILHSMYFQNKLRFILCNFHVKISLMEELSDHQYSKFCMKPELSKLLHYLLPIKYWNLIYLQISYQTVLSWDIVIWKRWIYGKMNTLQGLINKSILHKSVCDLSGKTTTYFSSKVKLLQNSIDRLKKEMVMRVNQVAAEFRKVSNKQMAETTKRTIRENVSINAQLAKMSDKTMELIQENDELKV